MNRVPLVLLIFSTLCGSWLGMQDVHELGHVTAAWLTGGRVAKVVFSPLTISRTDLAIDPWPLVVVWGGPIIGAALPLTIWAAAHACRVRGEFVLRFFAGFCLIANGAYIEVGSFDRVGDAGTMLTLGSPRWPLWLFGLITAPVGLGLLHGLGPQFGLGRAAGTVSRPVAYVTFASCLALFAAGFAFGGWD